MNHCTPLRYRTLPACAVFLALVAAGCGGDSPGGGPTEPNDSTPNPGEVQRATLTVTVRVDAPDQGVSGELGWAGGLVPGAVVVVNRLGSALTDTALTDASGKASVEGLLEGNYRISVLRLLEPSEAAQLSEANAEVNAFGGARTIAVAPPSAATELSVAAGRRGSLVISEMKMGTIQHPTVPQSYDLDNFIEIYNNSDTTIYLDGKLVGAGWARSVNQGLYPCTDYMHLLQDARGIWTLMAFRFPGSGRTYALRPGEAAVLAFDAIDHRDILPVGLDHSHADFEFYGRNDVDNPSVPNLESVGLWQPDIVDHGRLYNSIEGVIFLADPIDLSTLERQRASLPPSDPEPVLIPAEAILDVASYVEIGVPGTYCDQLVHPDHDRQTFGLAYESGPYWERSLQRPVLATLPGGQKILQRTRTSARDFARISVSPGALP